MSGDLVAGIADSKNFPISSILNDIWMFTAVLFCHKCKLGTEDVNCVLIYVSVFPLLDSVLSTKGILGQQLPTSEEWVQTLQQSTQCIMKKMTFRKTRGKATTTCLFLRSSKSRKQRIVQKCLTKTFYWFPNDERFGGFQLQLFQFVFNQVISTSYYQ